MDCMIIFVPFIVTAYLFLGADPLTQKWLDDLMEARRERRQV